MLKQEDIIENLKRTMDGYEFNLRGIPAKIKVHLKKIKKTGGYEFKQSHFLKTPVQAGPYETSSSGGYSEQDALDKALATFTHYYRVAVEEGHEPNESWLVYNYGSGIFV